MRAHCVVMVVNRLVKAALTAAMRQQGDGKTCRAV